jgi:hypothetical protein
MVLLRPLVQVVAVAVEVEGVKGIGHCTCSPCESACCGKSKQGVIVFYGIPRLKTRNLDVVKLQVIESLEPT